MAQTLPAAWADAEVLEGVDLVDKASLIGVPLMIEEVWFDTNRRGINYVYAYVQRADGEWVTFNDSSSGVRSQIIEALQARGLDGVIEREGESARLRLVSPRGLRVSEFDVDDDRGRQKRAKTYYLTCSGNRPQPKTEPVAKSSPTKSAKSASQK